MGKRKSSTKAVTKPKIVLSTAFKCLFCHHEKAVSVKLDKSTMFGSLSCKSCGQTFSSPINIDVYADWVDACEEARLKQPAKQRPINRGPNPFDHGFAGGVKMNMSDKPSAKRTERDADDDEVHEEDDGPAPRRARSYSDDDEEDEPPRRSDGGNKSSSSKKLTGTILDDEDDEDDEEDARDAARDKRRKVRHYDDDEDEDD